MMGEAKSQHCVWTLVREGLYRWVRQAHSPIGGLKGLRLRVPKRGESPAPLP